MRLYKQNILTSSYKKSQINNKKTIRLFNYILYKLIWMNANIIYSNVYDKSILQLYFIQQPTSINIINKKIIRFSTTSFPNNFIKKVV